MSEQGVSGFFVHSRQGLGQPYMSASYLDMVETALDEGLARGMAVHLYDEYPYPSGAAGGAVVQSDPGLAGSTLEAVHRQLRGGRVRVELPPGRLVACRAFPLSNGRPDWERGQDLSAWVGMELTRQSYHDAGPQAYNDRRFFADTPLPVLEVELPVAPVELWAVCLVPIAGHKYWGSFPDVTNPAAVGRFIELTHERYARRLGPKLASVTSMFTDEVEALPSGRVLAELEARYGESAADVCLAYVAPGHPAHVKALRDVDEIRLALFEGSFESQISDWCRANGVRYAGEKPSLRLSQLAWMDVPGCEPGHTKAGAPRPDLLQGEIRGNAKATASAAYFYGKEGSLCECFHSLGWGATLQDAKLIAESLVLLGTRWLVPHAFFYSIDGLRKHDAPPSLFHMPYWPLFGELARRVAAVLAAFEGTWLDAAVGVVEPAGSLPDAGQLACYEELQLALMAAHIDFLTVDLPILAAAQMADGCARLRDVALRCLIVPPGRDAEPGLEDWLARFSEAGGQVVRVGSPGEIEGAVTRARLQCPPSLSLAVDAGDGGRLLVASRKGPQGRLWFLLNTSAVPLDLVLAAEGGTVAALPLGAGPHPVLHATEGGQRLHLGGFESTLLAGPQAAAEAPPAPVLALQAGGTWTVRPEGPNILRLGHWSLTLPGQSGRSAVVEPAPIANQLLRSGLPFAPAIVDRFGSSPTIGLPRLLARYETAFDCTGPGAWDLVMQPGALGGDWQLWADGSGPYGAADLGPTDGPVAGCVGLALGCGPMGAGRGETRHRHTLVVELDADRSEHGLRDCLYVSGRFGVFAADAVPTGPASSDMVVPLLATLGPLPEEGRIGDWASNGLPYYAGTVEHSQAVPGRLEGDDGGEGDVEVEISLPPGCEDAAQVAFGDGPWHPLAWSPRRVRVPRRELRPAHGRVVVRLRMFTTLERTFEGRQFDPGVHRYRPVELAPEPHRRRGA
jgi:hypothetical protein